MADTRLDLIISLKDQASTALKRFSGDLDRLASDGSQVADTFGKVALAGAGVTAVLGKLGGDLQQTEVAFSTMLGSAEASKELLQELSTFAAKTPFDLVGLRNYSKQLIGAGFAQDEIVDSLSMLGDVASGVGVDKLPNLIYAFQQAKSQGVAFTQDLNQITGTGFNLAEALGMTNQELRNMASEGKLTFDLVKQGFENATSEGGKFNGLMDELSNTFLGQVSNLGDTLTQLGETIGVTLVPVLSSITLSILGLAEKIKTFVDNNPKIAEMAGKFLLIGTAITGVIAAVGLLFPIINNAVLGFKALGGIILGTNPVLLALIAAVGALALAWKNDWGGIQEKTKAVIDWITPKVKAFVGAIISFFGSLTSMLDTKFFRWMKEKFGEWYNNKKATIEAFVSIIRTSFDVVISVATWLVNTFTSITRAFTKVLDGDFSGAFTAIKDFLASIANLAIAGLESMINAWISGFNKLSAKISEWTDGLVNLGSATEVSLNRVSISAERTAFALDDMGGQIEAVADVAGEATNNTNDLDDSLDNLDKSAGGAASGGLKDFEKFVEDTNKSLEDLQGKIKNVQSELEQATEQYNSGIASNREDLAKTIVKTEEDIAKMQEERSALQKQLSDADTAEETQRIQEKLEQVQAELLEETRAYEAHSSLINELNKEIEEQRRWNSLTTLEQAVENYNKEQAVLAKQHSEKMAMLSQELTELKSQQEQIVAEVEARVKAVKEQYGEEADAYAMLMDENLRVTSEVLNSMISYYNQLARAREKAGVGGMIDINRFIVAPEASTVSVPSRSSGSGGAVSVVVNGDVTGEDLIDRVENALMSRLKLSSFIN